MKKINEHANRVGHCTCGCWVTLTPHDLAFTMVSGVLTNIFDTLPDQFVRFGIPFTEDYTNSVQKYLTEQLSIHFPLPEEAKAEARVEIIDDGTVNGHYRFTMSAYTNTSYIDYSVKGL